MATDLTRLSKFMSLVLRHQPREFGLAPDAEGFVPLSALLTVVRQQRGLGADLAEIMTVVEQGQPKRFELRGELVRAAYGHSFKGEAPVAYDPAEPPPTL